MLKLVLALSFLWTKTKAAWRRAISFLLAFRVSDVPIRKLIAAEVFSIATCVGFAVAALDVHHYFAAVLWFSIGSLTAVLSLAVGAFEIKDIRIRCAAIFVVFVVACLLPSYLVGIARDSENDYYTGKIKEDVQFSKSVVEAAATTTPDNVEQHIFEWLRSDPTLVYQRDLNPPTEYKFFYEVRQRTHPESPTKYVYRTVERPNSVVVESRLSEGAVFAGLSDKQKWEIVHVVELSLDRQYGIVGTKPNLIRIGLRFDIDSQLDKDYFFDGFRQVDVGLSKAQQIVDEEMGKYSTRGHKLP